MYMKGVKICPLIVETQEQIYYSDLGFKVMDAYNVFQYSASRVFFLNPFLSSYSLERFYDEITG